MLKNSLLLLFAFSSLGAKGATSMDCSKIASPEVGNFYETNPTLAKFTDDTPDWKFLSPADAGLNQQKLELATDALRSKPFTWNLLVVKNNAIVWEKYFNGSNKNASHNVHSLSKSILSAAMGIALSQGKIKGTDQYLSELLPKHFRSITDPRRRSLKVQDLLTMRGGIKWREDDTEYEIEKKKDWVRAILKLKSNNDPGTEFLYSTALTHLMSAAITEATKTSLCKFVHQELFQKIGVEAERWGRDPQGYFSGGYNLYLTPRDVAKFGMLYLNQGKWKNEQVVPAQWVTDSLQKQVSARPGFDYGYNWWLREIAGHKVSFAWGYGGQYLYLIRDLNMAVVITTNTKDFEPEFDAEPILKDFIIPAAS